MKRSSRNKNRGTVLGELVLIVPILFFLSQGIIEMTKYLRFQQSVSVIGREIANAVFRNCSGVLDDNVQSCIDQQVAALSPALGQIISNPDDVKVLTGMHRLSQVPLIVGGIKMLPENPTVRTSWVAPGTSVEYPQQSSNNTGAGSAGAYSGEPHSAGTGTPGACSAGVCYTAFATSRFDDGGDLRELIKRNGVVVTTEVFYPYQALGPVGKLIFSKEHFILETTIF